MEKQVDLENEKDPDTEWTIVARYREEGRSGIDVHQDEDDPPLSGQMKIMLFETEIPGWNPTIPSVAAAAHEKTLRKPVLTTGFSERMERLPR